MLGLCRLESSILCLDITLLRMRYLLPLQVVQNAANYGITNLADACYIITPPKADFPRPIAQPIGRGGGDLCDSPNSHLFFDQYVLHLKTFMTASAFSTRIGL